MDVLSDVLLSVRLTGAVFFAVDAPRRSRPSRRVSRRSVSRVLAGAEHVISFHIVTEGTCWAETIDHSDAAGPARAGDIVVFPAGNTNVMASAPGMRGRPDPARTTARPTARCRSTLATAREPGAAHTRSSAASWVATLGRSTRCSMRCPASSTCPSPTESRQWVDSLVESPSRPAAARAPVGRRCWPSSRS